MVYLYIIINIMRKAKPALLPKLERILSDTGENIKLARLRRRLSAEQVAERANITRVTLSKIEKGSGRVAFESYAQVLFVLGLETDLLKLAGEDPLGRKLQDAGLVVKERAPKKSW
jgi:transcriptional regulator with XRE-family HTH domain